MKKSSTFLLILAIALFALSFACGDDDDDDAKITNDDPGSSAAGGDDDGGDDDDTSDDDDTADDDDNDDDDGDDDDDDETDDDDDTEEAITDVSIENMSMNPDPVTIGQGGTVRWTNNDSVPHSTTSGQPDNPDGLWDSGLLDPGDTYSRTFDSAGTYIYYCKAHPTTMNGYVVNVQ
ncbi:MAG: plastocyanin/azurin family copper-binding protein [Deltaproteobacteria bacterium]|nr:plastocyanin/azurin family copper-binding protein [Deltaproteobacteria bacterium]